ncbi:MAG TPA: FAD-dependent oxidoreductase [Candidatus Dormibacteraeota bacterium]|nr:FAD-dependent oxidoreductase [Candidatus Dormibacteraeota bacterium]
MAWAGAARRRESAPGCRSGAGSNRWRVRAFVVEPASFVLTSERDAGEKWRRLRRYRTHVRESRPQPLPYMSRVAVVGGGVIGCAAAELLSRQKHQVTLLERDHLASHASGAAAGELSPSTRPGDHESLAMFPELVARIETESG